MQSTIPINYYAHLTNNVLPVRGGTAMRLGNGRRIVVDCKLQDEEGE